MLIIFLIFVLVFVEKYDVSPTIKENYKKFDFVRKMLTNTYEILFNMSLYCDFKVTNIANQRSITTNF